MYLICSKPVRNPASSTGWDYRVLGAFETKSQAEAGIARVLAAHPDHEVQLAPLGPTIYTGDVKVKKVAPPKKPKAATAA